MPRTAASHKTNDENAKPVSNGKAVKKEEVVSDEDGDEDAEEGDADMDGDDGLSDHERTERLKVKSRPSPAAKSTVNPFAKAASKAK